MNEVLQELVYKADPNVYDKLDRHVLDAFLTKFSKLVVKECLDVAMDEVMSDTDVEEATFAVEHYFNQE